MKNIYLITNDFNNKVYVGQTKQTLEKRFAGHVQQASVIFKDNLLEFSLFHVLIHEIGEEHFHIELLETCSDETGNEREQFYINKYKSTNLNYGYNTANPSKNNVVDGRTEKEIEEKIVDLYVNENLAIKRIAEQIHKQQKFVSNLLRKKGLLKGNVGGHVTKQNYAFPITAVNPKTKEDVRSFENQYEAARYILDQKITAASYDNVLKNIQMVARGTGGKTAYGYYWRKDGLSYYDEQKLKNQIM